MLRRITKAVNNLNQSDKMTERELLILKMRFGIDIPNQETWTLHQIAKLFGISYERVRQIEVRALKKLRNNPDMQELRHLVIDEGVEKLGGGGSKTQATD